MELHTLPQEEQPVQAVAGAFPGLGDGRNDGEAPIVLDEAIKNLLGDRKAVDVADERGV
jgi:hypothetical protein